MAEPNKYSHTTRKMFNAGIDRLDRKISELKKEVRILESRLNARSHDISTLSETMDELEFMIRTLEPTRKASTDHLPNDRIPGEPTDSPLRRRGPIP